MGKRVLFLDVDDTFSFFGEWVIGAMPAGFSGEGEFRVDRDGVEWIVVIEDGVGAAYRSDLPLMLDALGEVFEFVWCTSWGGEAANAFWGSRLGLGVLDAVRLRGSRVDAINEWLRERDDVSEAVWVDDAAEVEGLDARVSVVVPGVGGLDWGTVGLLGL